MTWDPLHLPDQHGKTFVVTGGNAGIGYFAAEQLARAGGHVVIASRNPDKVAIAQAAIRGEVPDASLGFVRLDLTSLASVRDAAAELSALPRIDAIVLNAGVMSMPGKKETTEDGFPPMIGSYLGNFALTAGILNSSEPGRIVHTSSGFVRRAKLDISDLTAPPRSAGLEYTRRCGVWSARARSRARGLQSGLPPTRMPPAGNSSSQRVR
jgi:NAD(P)-dependent dehydrogenase (short-subunit alcohol dehydrogenase family)